MKSYRRELLTVGLVGASVFCPIFVFRSLSLPFFLVLFLITNLRSGFLHENVLFIKKQWRIFFLINLFFLWILVRNFDYYVCVAGNAVEAARLLLLWLCVCTLFLQFNENIEQKFVFNKNFLFVFTILISVLLSVIMVSKQFYIELFLKMASLYSPDRYGAFTKCNFQYIFKQMASMYTYFVFLSLAFALQSRRFKLVFCFMIFVAVINYGFSSGASFVAFFVSVVVAYACENFPKFVCAISRAGIFIYCLLLPKIIFVAKKWFFIFHDKMESFYNCWIYRRVVSFGCRLLIWEFCFSKILKNGLIGDGVIAKDQLCDAVFYFKNLGKFPNHHGDYFFSNHPHNFLINIWMNVGAIGVIICVFLLSLLLKNACKQCPQNRYYLYGILCFNFLLGQSNEAIESVHWVCFLGIVAFMRKAIGDADVSRETI
ncbi:hypothetical protein [Candidatus Hydrogenosomobacter endosymbioticus]|uniref:hypothetical protein n=1 Tax=Candidatus Hydrogenosomobacter endosymbioticus TaxID=2558174 RepID=UPI001F27074E|nr:hypothetical protein [Candidatus Hydrogenosomobacter endosymbioticus]